MDLILINKKIEHPSMVMCTRYQSVSIPWSRLRIYMFICWDCIVDPFYAKTHYKNMLKNAKFEVKKIQLNKIIFKNGCLMRVDNTESFQEKKSLFKKYWFFIKKVCAKKRALCGTILWQRLLPPLLETNHTAKL